ncbi:T9SS type A sorting domain-containing protein [bacterium]|nr:T9SS type A sorting domain-containing protein [bacterium]
MRFLIILFTGIVLSFPALNAEEVILIHDTEGGYVSYNIEDVSLIDFSDNDGLVVHHLDQETEYPLDEISKITYNPDAPPEHVAEPTNFESIPETFILHDAYPNPFNPSTTISYQLEDAGMVSLTVFDINGRLIKSLVSERQTSGAYTVEWKGNNNSGQTVTAGLYFYHLSVDNGSQTRKMLLLK